MHADWSADGIAKLSIFEPVLAWEYLDPFLETAAFDGATLLSFGFGLGGVEVVYRRLRTWKVSDHIQAKDQNHPATSER